MKVAIVPLIRIRRALQMAPDFTSRVEDSGDTAVGWSKLFSALRSALASVVILTVPEELIPFNLISADLALGE